MRAIINFLRGHVLFTVTGAFPERFLNLCAQNGVAFWDLVWLDEHTLRLRFARRDARRVRGLAEKVMCEVAVGQRSGVPFFLAQFKKRYALLLGLALSLATVCVLSQFVLTVEVSGNEKVPTAAILSELQRQGVRVGAYGPGLKVRQISQQALLAIPDLSWMTVNLHGVRAEVIVREKLPKPELRDETTPAHVVSGATGIITHMEVLDGQANFQEGDTVLEGEIIISGVTDLKEPKYGTVDAGQRLVHARGKVYARTWRTLTAQIPLEAQVKTYTGEEQTRLSLLVLGRSVNFFGNGGISMDKYDKITKTYCLTLPGGREMPLALRREQYRGYTPTAWTLDTAAARTMLEEQLAARLRETIGDGEVLKEDFTAREENGLLTVTLLAECQEQIGREVTFEGTVGDTTPPQPITQENG